MTSQSIAPANRRSLWTLLSVVVIDLIGFGIVIPILPFYAEAYGASAFELGLLVTCFAGMQFLLAPVWGRLSDRIGRRPVILLTVAGTSLALLTCGLADSLAWLFVGRILGGAFGANIGIATAYITDVTGPEERTRWMGMIGASFGVGFILGPAIGGFLSRFGYGVPLLLAAGLGAVNFVYAFFNVREPEEREVAPPALVSAARAAARNRLARRLMLLNFFFTFSISQLETMFAFFMLQRFGYDVQGVTVLLVIAGLVMVGIQGGAIRPLSRRFGEFRLLLAGSLLLMAAFFTLPFSPTVAVLLVPLIGSSVGRGIAQPSMLSLVSHATTEANRGTVLGAFQSAASLARVLSPLVAGILFQLRPWGPFVAAGAVMSLVVALTLVLKASNASQETSPLAQAG